jgi:hypothetical protein
VEYELHEKHGYVLISSWNKRQFASDDVTERVLKHQKNKRLTKRYRTEQNRAESPPSDLCDSSIFSYSIDQDDQPATSPGGATPPESSSTEKDTINERVRPTLRITEEMFERFLAKNGEKELRDLMECAKGCFDNGQDEQVNAALWYTMTFYEPKGGPTSAKVYFRQELKERL